MYNVWLLISNPTFLKDLTFLLNQLHVNHKLHFSQSTITLYDRSKVLKTLGFFFACYYLRMHDSHSNAFVFHLLIQQFHL